MMFFPMLSISFGKFFKPFVMLLMISFAICPRDENIDFAPSEMQDAIPTSFDTGLTASGLPTSSLTSTGGMATSALVEAFKTAMAGMEIEMGEDGFAQFVVKTISKEIYQ